MNTHDVQTQRRIAEAEARWDSLLATDRSQHLLERLADEALEEIQAGLARPVTTTEDGEMVPG